MVARTLKTKCNELIFARSVVILVGMIKLKCGAFFLSSKHLIDTCPIEHILLLHGAEHMGN